MKLQRISKEERIEYFGDELGWRILVSAINNLQNYINEIIDHLNLEDKNVNGKESSH